ncbi:MAG: c-type cytochrome [Anaerolineae bacterium]
MNSERVTALRRFSLRRPGVWAVLGLLLALLLVGVAGAQGGGDKARGAQIYDANCAVCHGPDGKGRVGATLSSVFSSIQPDALIRQTVANGIAGTAMPAWLQPGGPLTEQDISDLVAFIEGLSGGRPGEFPTPALKQITPIATLADVAGDPTAGAGLYSENCVMCHGDKGQGRIGARLSKAFSGIRPDLSVRSTIINGISGSAMPAWSQTKGGPLTDDEVNNLTAFILTLAPVGDAAATAVPTPAPAPSSGLLLPMWAVAGLVGILLLLAVAVVIFARAA